MRTRQKKQLDKHDKCNLSYNYSQSYICFISVWITDTQKQTFWTRFMAGFTVTTFSAVVAQELPSRA